MGTPHASLSPPLLPAGGRAITRPSAPLTVVHPGSHSARATDARTTTATSFVTTHLRRAAHGDGPAWVGRPGLRNRGTLCKVRPGEPPAPWSQRCDQGRDSCHGGGMARLPCLPQLCVRSMLSPCRRWRLVGRRRGQECLPSGWPAHGDSLLSTLHVSLPSGDPESPQIRVNGCPAGSSLSLSTSTLLLEKASLPN